MILNKSLIAGLSRMTHSYLESASTLDAKTADTSVGKKEKDDNNWLHVNPNDNCDWLQQAICYGRLLLLVVVSIITYRSK